MAIGVLHYCVCHLFWRSHKKDRTYESFYTSSIFHGAAEARRCQNLHNLPLLLCAACWLRLSYGQTAPAQTAPATQPDNTAVNQRDRSSVEPTADQQKMNATDRQLTASIRRSIVTDKSLSTYAHNIKIISQNGSVTLKGPVKSDDEKKTVVAKAVAAAGGADKVHDEISVKQ
jgi:hypothetical protein